MGIGKRPYLGNFIIRNLFKQLGRVYLLLVRIKCRRSLNPVLLFLKTFQELYVTFKIISVCLSNFVVKCSAKQSKPSHRSQIQILDYVKMNNRMKFFDSRFLMDRSFECFACRQLLFILFFIEFPVSTSCTWQLPFKLL